MLNHMLVRNFTNVSSVGKLSVATHPLGHICELTL